MFLEIFKNYYSSYSYYSIINQKSQTAVSFVIQSKYGQHRNAGFFVLFPSFSAAVSQFKENMCISEDKQKNGKIWEAHSWNGGAGDFFKVPLRFIEWKTKHKRVRHSHKNIHSAHAQQLVSPSTRSHDSVYNLISSRQHAAFSDSKTYFAGSLSQTSELKISRTVKWIVS